MKKLVSKEWPKLTTFDISNFPINDSGGNKIGTKGLITLLQKLSNTVESLWLGFYINILENCGMTVKSMHIFLDYTPKNLKSLLWSNFINIKTQIVLETKEQNC